MQLDSCLLSGEVPVNRGPLRDCVFGWCDKPALEMVAAVYGQVATTLVGQCLLNFLAGGKRGQRGRAQEEDGQPQPAVNPRPSLLQYRPEHVPEPARGVQPDLAP